MHIFLNLWRCLECAPAHPRPWRCDRDGNHDYLFWRSCLQPTECTLSLSDLDRHSSLTHSLTHSHYWVTTLFLWKEKWANRAAIGSCKGQGGTACRLFFWWQSPRPWHFEVSRWKQRPRAIASVGVWSGRCAIDVVRLYWHWQQILSKTFTLYLSSPAIS